MSMKYLARVCACVATFLTVSSVANAAPVLFPLTGSIDGNISVYFTDPPTPIADVRGFSTVQVVEFTTVEDLGTGFVLGSGPYPSNLLALVDSGTTEGVGLAFDFASSTFPSGFPGPQWQVNVFGSPLTSVTLPALIGFLGNDIAQFTLLSEFPNGAPILDTEGVVVGISYPYRLDFIAGTGESISAVPEPATLCLVGSGIAFAVRRRGKKSHSA